MSERERLQIAKAGGLAVASQREEKQRALKDVEKRANLEQATTALAAEITSLRTKNNQLLEECKHLTAELERAAPAARKWFNVRVRTISRRDKKVGPLQISFLLPVV